MPYKEPVLLFGNLLDFILRKSKLLMMSIVFFRPLSKLIFVTAAFNEKHFLFYIRYFGFYETTINSILILKDLEPIKKICIKSFDAFPEHQSLGLNEDTEPLWEKNLLFAKGTCRRFTK